MRGRVLILGNFLSGGGSGSRGVCEDLSDRLRRAGWGVVTASTHRNRLVRLADMCRTVVGSRGRYDVAQIDVFSGPAFFWAEATGWLLTRMGKPFVLALRGGDLPRFARRFGGRVRRLFRAADRVVAPSGYLARSMTVPGVTIQTVPNPIDLAAYPYVCRERPEPRLMWLRALHAIYNPVLAPRVLARLVGEFAQAELVMAGPDKGDGTLGRLEAEVRRQRLEGRVRVVGGVPKSAVPALLRTGDVFLNTTDVDNTPVSVLEAMACGLCVVTTNAGGIPFLVEEGREALLVGRDDAAAMADAVGRVLKEPGLAARLSEAGRRKAESMDWSRVLPMWEEVLGAARRRESSRVAGTGTGVVTA